MADPFGTGAGVLGVIGLAIQVTQIIVQFSMEWKEVPENVKMFMTELGTLKTVLSETNTNILVNPDFAEAFQNRPSLLLSQLGPNAPLTTDTKSMLDTCQKELDSLLKELKKRGQGHQVGWERLKGAFRATKTRDSVVSLCRQCQTLNNMLSIDVALLGVTTYKELRDVRKEQQEWRQADIDTSTAIRRGVEQTNRWQENQDCQAILNWLTPIDYAPQQSDFLSRREAGTGQWLLDSAEFQAWLNTDNQTLYCPGIPGAGKTILTSVVIEKLITQFSNDPTIGIAYIYCNFRRQDEQKINDLLASLLKQLAMCQPALPDSIKDLHDRCKTRRASPDEILRVLQVIASACSGVFIIVDALDECQVSDGCRSRFISNISTLQAKTGAKLFATSRPIMDIEREFKGCLSREILATNEDVQIYLENRMSQLPSFVRRNPDLQDQIKLGIIRAVEGMFLLAQLYLDSLEDKTTAKAMKIALNQFQKQTRESGESNKLEVLSLAYTEAMERINGQKAGFRQLAEKVLSWIICAKRPLTITELQEAIAVEDGDSELDKDNLPEVDDMVSVCCGLVTVDEESNIIRLVHYTTQEYFERTQNQWFPDAETIITTTCITYLSFDVFNRGFCPTYKEFLERVQLNRLFLYAAHNWGYHACKASLVGRALRQAIVDFLESKNEIAASSQGLLYQDTYPYSKYTLAGHSLDHGSLSGLHLTAYFGIEDVVQLLLDTGRANLNARDAYGQTPLFVASRLRREAVVKLLLDTGKTDINVRDMDGDTPLVDAVLWGYKDIVKLLLDTGKADVNARGTFFGATPLLSAVMYGHGDIVKLLLDTGKADVNARGTFFSSTPLLSAVLQENGDIVKLLLDTGKADVNSKDEGGWTPLLIAAGSGYSGIVQLLLENGADISVETSSGWTAVQLATFNNHKEVEKLFMMHGVPEPEDIYGLGKVFSQI